MALKEVNKPVNSVVGSCHNDVTRPSRFQGVRCLQYWKINHLAPQILKEKMKCIKVNSDEFQQLWVPSSGATKDSLGI